MPARHRSWDPVALTVRLDHPAGPLPVVATCLEHGIPYTDDRIAQGDFVADLATDPSSTDLPGAADGRPERHRRLSGAAGGAGPDGRRLDRRLMVTRTR